MNRKEAAIKSLKKYWPQISVYSVAHFLVDFCCAFCMLRFINGTKDAPLCFLVYNFCAFAMQMPLGLIADKLNRNYLVAMTGCIMVGAAFLLATTPTITVIVLGTGNALFHIGGGIDVLNISRKKLSALGIFVSPGAFGIYFGTIAGVSEAAASRALAASGVSGVFGISTTLNALAAPQISTATTGMSQWAPLLLPIILIIVAVAIFIAHRRKDKDYPQNPPLSLAELKSSNIIIAIACFFLVVCLRSFVGLSLSFEWKSTGAWALVLICAVVFGKTMGGIFADCFGLVKTTVVSLGAAALLFLLPTVPIAGVTAVFLFNMTMPLTLWVMAKIMPAAKGFAFGMLTFGLFIGYVPIYLNIALPAGAHVIFAIMSFASVVLLLVGYRKAII